MSYISRKSSERMKSYSIFPNTNFAKSPNFAPSQFRNRGAFWENKNIFGKYYPNTLKNAQKAPILKQFFLKWSFKHGLHLFIFWILIQWNPLKMCVENVQRFCNVSTVVIKNFAIKMKIQSLFLVKFQRFSMIFFIDPVEHIKFYRKA